MSAIHKEHNFDPTIGKFGIPRGDYEKITLNVLYDYGRNAILCSERTPRGTQFADGLLDNNKFEIKGIDGIGKNNIANNLFSEEQIQKSYQSYLRNSKRKRISHLYYILNGKLYAIK